MTVRSNEGECLASVKDTHVAGAPARNVNGRAHRVRIPLLMSRTTFEVYGNRCDA